MLVQMLSSCLAIASGSNHSITSLSQWAVEVSSLALLHHIITLCFSLARNIHFQSLKQSMATPNFAHVPKSLVLVPMVLIALSMCQEWMEKAGLTLEEGSEVALGLHWRYFASDAPCCCCSWKPRGAGSSCLCANWTGLLLCVCRNHIPCKSCQSLLLLSMFLKPLYSFLLFHLTTGWARSKTFCVWLETSPNRPGEEDLIWNL